jgi:hypothetical protein
VKFLTAIVVVVILITMGGATAEATADRASLSATTYQGKSAKWWAHRAVQARKNANARAMTIKRLKKTIRITYSIKECVKLATIAYPALTENRAWRIIGGESHGNPNARNTKSIWNGEHAAGLWQFIPSTFASTPYGKAGMSIWSPCASSLAAGYMHSVGRGNEWDGY